MKKCDKIKPLFFSYFNHELSRDEELSLETHLQTCPDCKSEFDTIQAVWESLGNLPEPPVDPIVITQFTNMLNSYQEAGPRKTYLQQLIANFSNFFNQLGQRHYYPRFAYSLLLILISFSLGYYFSRVSDAGGNYAHHDKSSVIADKADKKDLFTLLNSPYAPVRLRAVAYSNDLPSLDSTIVYALITTLNNDTNDNVRLAALESLSRLSHNPYVRQELIKSLTNQESPIVQVALIDLMLELQEKRSIKYFKKMLKRNSLNSIVKSRITETIQKLG